MDQQTLDYVKGHCGWDSVTLLYGDQIPAREEHRIAHTLLAPPCDGGVEVGFLYPSKEADCDIRLRIIDATTRTWLPMCGGMSQVIGLACMTTEMQDYFHIEKRVPTTQINVRSDSGLVPIDVTFTDSRIAMITTHLLDYVDYLYADGVRPVSIDGLPAMKVGYFLVFRMDDLEKAHPQMGFGHRRRGPALNLLGEIQMAYIAQEGIEASTLYSMIYDQHPENGGDARIFTRFFKGRGVPQSSPMEIQCGTGSAAVAIAMAERGELPFSGESGAIMFEWGSGRLTADPYGVRKSVVHLTLSGRKIRTATFSHNVVELQSAGKLFLPSFERHLF